MIINDIEYTDSEIFGEYLNYLDVMYDEFGVHAKVMTQGEFLKECEILDDLYWWA